MGFAWRIGTVDAWGTPNLSIGVRSEMAEMTSPSVGHLCLRMTVIPRRGTFVHGDDHRGSSNVGLSCEGMATVAFPGESRRWSGYSAHPGVTATVSVALGGEQMFE